MPARAPWHMGTSHSLRGPVPVVGVCAEGCGSDSPLPSPQTRVLVTHGISFLPQTDFVVVLADGQVSEVGTYPALLQRNGSFANFLHNYAPDEGEEHLEESSRTGTPGPPCPCPLPASPLPQGLCVFVDRAQCCAREGLGNLDPLCDGQSSPGGKGSWMKSVPPLPLP